MTMMPIVSRLRCATLIALSGGAVAQTMTIWGGDLARFLPPSSVMSLAGAGGAWLAGFAMVGAFGREGWRGVICSALMWPVVTAFGAALGAVLLVLMPLAVPSRPAWSTLDESAGLGLLAVGDGITTSPVVAGVWLLSCAAIHHGARHERRGFT